MKTIKAKVHRLPTEKSDLLIDTIDGNIYYTPLFNQEKTVNVKPQHLFITTDEEIKEGDWFLNETLRTVSRANKENSKAIKEFNHSDIRKIIASTDSLHLRITYKEYVESKGTHERFLPQIPQSFIEEYCKAGGIDEVLVECDMEYCTCLEWKETYECPNHYIDNHTQKVMCSKEPTNQSKLNSDNTIIIHPVEEKVLVGKDIANMRTHAMFTIADYILEMPSGISHEVKKQNVYEHIEALKQQWIEENL